MSAQSKGKTLLYQMHRTIHHYFPDLYARLSELSDERKGTTYSVCELLVGGLSLFLFKEGSRNAFNADRKEGKFRANYEKVFKLKLPHMDTVEDLFRQLPAEELAALKPILIGQLMKKKVLHKFKVLGKSFVVAIDGVHVATYEADYCGECLHKTSSKGKKTYFHYVLEAKLVSSKGLSLSLASEWIANTEQEYDKQDCELKAFVRLANTLKGYFPRLPICITADGLYPNRTFFDICRDNQWDFILTFKEGNLPSVWEEIGLLPSSATQHRTHTFKNNTQEITRTYSWINGIDYHGHCLNWIECKEEIQPRDTAEKKEGRFVHLSSFPLDSQSAPEVSQAGRLRWKIENEGFNTQKNHGYGLGHKFSRASFNAFKNYYQALQIAHIIHQLLIHSQALAALLQSDAKLTLKHLWKQLLGYMTHYDIDPSPLHALTEKRSQIRLC